MIKVLIDVLSIYDKVHDVTRLTTVLCKLLCNGQGYLLEGRTLKITYVPSRNFFKLNK